MGTKPVKLQGWNLVESYKFTANNENFEKQVEIITL